MPINEKSHVIYRFLFLFSIISLSFLLLPFISYSEGVCPTGQIRCGTACVSPLTDSKNCGACGRVCLAGFVCKDGGVKAGATRKLINPQTKLPAKQIGSTKTKRLKPDENAGNIAAPFIPVGAEVSAPIEGIQQLKDAAGANATGGGGSMSSSSGG
jgi:hypothetical protein